MESSWAVVLPLGSWNLHGRFPSPTPISTWREFWPFKILPNIMHFFQLFLIFLSQTTIIQYIDKFQSLPNLTKDSTLICLRQSLSLSILGKSFPKATYAPFANSVLYS